MYVITFKSVGNPDFGQYAPVSDPETVQAGTIEELQRAAEDYRDNWGLGGGNWAPSAVYAVDAVTKRKRAVGRISYNGRYWPK